jgi:hypothetical protein
MTEVWIVGEVMTDSEGNSKGDWFLQGVFTTKEKALELCDRPSRKAVRFELDKDYTDITEFETFP